MRAGQRARFCGRESYFVPRIILVARRQEPWSSLHRHYTSKHAVSTAQLVDLIHDDRGRRCRFRKQWKGRSGSRIGGRICELMLPLRLARLNFTTTAPAIMKDGRAVISGDWGNFTCG